MSRLGGGSGERRVPGHRMKRDGHVGRDSPRRGGPDKAVDVVAGERGIDLSGIGRQGEAHPDGGAGMVGVFDLGLGQRGAVAHAPVHRLQAFVDVAPIEEFHEGGGDHREVMRSDTFILLATQKNASDDDPSTDSIYGIGTLASVLQLLKLPDGTVKVLVEGAARAQVKQYTDREEYYEADAVVIADTSGDQVEAEAMARSVINEFEGDRKRTRLNSSHL